MASSPKKLRLRDSKKAIAFIVGVVQLNVLLILSLWHPTLAAGDFLNALTFFVSLYITGEASVDVARSLKTKKEDELPLEDGSAAL